MVQPQITARHFQASPALRQYVSDRLSKLERYYDGITDARVVLVQDKSAVAEKTAEITLGVYKQRLAAQDSGTTHEEAIDRCAESLRRQILKYKARLRSIDKNAHR